MADFVAPAYHARSLGDVVPAAVHALESAALAAVMEAARVGAMAAETVVALANAAALKAVARVWAMQPSALSAKR